MRILFGLGHPAHFHLFKNFFIYCKINKYDFLVVITNKDVLESLLIKGSIKYINLNQKCLSGNIFLKVKKILYSTKELYKITKKYKPHYLIGCMSQLGYIGTILKIPSFFWAEDDFKITWIQGLFTYPFVTNIITPIVTNIPIYKRKIICYYGYHELAYLHPNNFEFNIEKVKKYISIENPFFIIRFAKLEAYHDKGIKGINSVIAEKIIEILEPYGKIYITSERKLESKLERYRININPFDIHYFLAFAKLYIGDSQTMAAEAGVVGTPFIRFNDFVGRISYLNELENKYELGYGFKTNQVEEMIAKIKELLSFPNLKQEFQKRREKMLSEKIDVMAFMVWFIENYPESVRIMKDNPDYQYRFK
jgi:predicted glycosyltransferase